MNQWYLNDLTAYISQNFNCIEGLRLEYSKEFNCIDFYKKEVLEPTGEEYIGDFFFDEDISLYQFNPSARGIFDATAQNIFIVAFILEALDLYTALDPEGYKEIQLPERHKKKQA